MKVSELEHRLEAEMSDLAPNRLDDLLNACEDRAGVPRPVEVSRRPRRNLPRILAAAAIFILLIGGALGYHALDASRCVLTFDVNPSVSLTVNRFNRVREVMPLNADAEALLETVNLKGARLEKAVQMLTTALVDESYLSGMQNAVVVSVEDATDARAEALCKKVVNAIEETAMDHWFHSAVLYQRISGENDLHSVAESLNVSVGKAALAATLAAQLENTSTERLSALPVQDLLFLVKTRDIAFENADLFGTVNSLSYHDSDAAAAIALKNAGLSDVPDSDITASFDGRDGELVYIVSFSDGTWSYCYTISAKSGAILEMVQTSGDTGSAPELEHNSGGGGAAQPDVKPQTQPEDTTELVGIDDVLTHVLQFVHRTLAEVQNPNVELQWINGRPVYCVSFEAGGQTHQFYVDARTNDIF